MDQKAEIIFSRIRQQLKFVQLSLNELEDLKTDPEIRQKALANIITFGRSVTFVIQNLKSVVHGFEDWYYPEQEIMSKDPLLIFFKNSRNNLEKQGVLETSITITIKRPDHSILENHIKNPPPGALSFFVGDHLGGSGWLIEMPDGSTEKLYVDLTDHVFTELTFLPTGIEHLGVELTDLSAQNASRLYYEYLKTLVNKADSHFA